MRVGSLFSGIGGLELGLERAGMQTVWQVEQDPYALAVLKKHWPNVRRHNDVRTFPPEGDWSCDLICGGFPCQDVSLAGKRAGLKEGNRSGLWLEFARIIRTLRPRFVVVENVPGLLSDGLGRVLGDLAESGYDAEWGVLSPCELGAPHTRDRVFIVAYPVCIEREGRNGKQRGCAEDQAICGSRGYPDSGRHQDYAGNRVLPQTVAEVEDSGSHRLSENSWSHFQRKQEWWSSEHSPPGVANGVRHRVDRHHALGNAVVPQVAEVIGRMIMEAHP